MFANRSDAGRRLAQVLAGFQDAVPVILGLPRGGVVVAEEVAQALSAPLDVIVVRKLGAPWQPELAMGAIGEGGVRVLDERVIRQIGAGPQDIDAAQAREERVLADRVQRFRGGRPPVPIEGRTAIIVDDGIATGSTARAACLVARARGAAEIVLAVPVAPAGIARDFASVSDRVVCVSSPADFYAVGQFYVDFTQTSDAEVTRILERARG